MSNSATPWTAARQRTVLHYLLSLLKLMSIESVMPSNQLIICCSFLQCPQSFPASRAFLMSQLFATSGQSVGASPSASLLPMNIRGWSSLWLTGLIPLLSKEISIVFSSTTAWRHQSFSAQPFLWSSSHIC